ncbi:MAG TPA: PKD domain-containing protein [Candidatus Saccharimonadales bacterium]|nr:PKD domain-containing protein [Candidatus Saccharimonadales bacterium]
MSNYLLVVGNDTALTAQDTFIHDRLVGQSHTVTYIDDGASVPANIDITYHAVIMSNTANINQITTKYDATTRGVFSLFPFPHSKFYGAANPANSTTGTTLYVVVSTPDTVIPSGSGTTATYLTATAIHTYLDSTSIGSGAVNMLASRSDLLTRIAGTRYDTGGLLSDGTTTAPSRRLRFGFTDLTLLNATGLTWFDNAVTWVTTALANQSPTANAGVDQSVAAAATVTLDGSGSSDPDGTIASYAWTQVSGTAVTLSSASAQKPTFTSPASMSGATLVFGLTVTDNQGASSSQDTVSITVAPRAQVKTRITGAWVAKPLKARTGGVWHS